MPERKHSFLHEVFPKTLYFPPVQVHRGATACRFPHTRLCLLRLVGSGQQPEAKLLADNFVKHFFSLKYLAYLLISTFWEHDFDINIIF